MGKIRVQLIDDSAVVRQVLQAVLAEDPAVEVIGAAADPIFALAQMGRQWPDVILLDVEMPRMDGITFLRKIMAVRPTPVVICSSLTGHGTATALEALAAGAVQIVAKPSVGLKAFLRDASEDLIGAVKAAARANLGNLCGAGRGPAVAAKLSADAVLPPAGGAMAAMAETTERIVAIGTSTGGTQALEVVLAALPRVCPGLVIVQHMPEKFTASFAQRLDRVCAIEVKEAASGDRVLPGRALIAPGGRHLLLRRAGAQYHVEVSDGPLVNRHRPSVDVLFRSVARAAGKNALGIIMTGMGDDGAAGLLEMRQAGAHTVAQDEASCVVFGMPKAAIERGGAQDVLPLAAMTSAIQQSGPGLPAPPRAAAVAMH